MARKCPVCGSRKWRKDGVTGSVVCEDGHVLQGVRSEEHILTEATGHQMQKRRLNRGPRENKRKVHGRANQEYLHGEQADYLRLQGLQLLLRSQVAALQKLWSLPDPFELIVRDLWAYQLAITPNRSSSRAPSPEPDAKSKGKQKATEGSDSEKIDEPERPQSRSRSRSVTDSEEGSGSGSDSADNDSDLEKLESEKSDDEEEVSNTKVTTPRKPWERRRTLHASDTLVCLVLGMWHIRLPFTYADIERLVNSSQIPYLDFAKTTLVPEEMAKAMNKNVAMSLRPQRSPRPATLWRFSRRFARTLQQYFGLVVPEANSPPLALRVLSPLGGTALTHSQVMAVLALVDANMSLTETSLKSYTRKRRNSTSTETVEYAERYNDVHMPELSILASWVIVMKLAYGLDGQRRVPMDKSDPLIRMPTCDDWLNELYRHIQSGVLRQDTDLVEQNFQAMDTDDIDRFLDKAEDVLLKDRRLPSDFATREFPLPAVTRTEPKLPPPNSWAAFHAQAPRDPVTPAALKTAPGSELPLLPGDKLQSFHPDRIENLPADYVTVVRAAAAVIGVDVRMVHELVWIFERRLELARPKREYPSAVVARRLHGPALRESRSMGSLA